LNSSASDVYIWCDIKGDVILNQRGRYTIYTKERSEFITDQDVETTFDKMTGEFHESQRNEVDS
jgi:hypothetical protein